MWPHVPADHPLHEYARFMLGVQAFLVLMMAVVLASKVFLFFLVRGYSRTAAAERAESEELRREVGRLLAIVTEWARLGTDRRADASAIAAGMEKRVEGVQASAQLAAATAQRTAAEVRQAVAEVPEKVVERLKAEDGGGGGVVPHGPNQSRG